jgi:uncharacterized protein YjbI with pentapeptide repeats
MPLELQYLLFFEIWYKSLQLTKNVRQKDMKNKLEIIGSNCVNLLAAMPNCNLTERDFSNCTFPHAYFLGRDLSGSNFSYSNMRNSLIAKANLNNS